MSYKIQPVVSKNNMSASLEPYFGIYSNRKDFLRFSKLLNKFTGLGRVISKNLRFEEKFHFLKNSLYKKIIFQFFP